MAKSSSVTYFLWMFGGLIGLHHFYLGRDRHAFIWWATLGGCCGLGWFRDMWRIGDYVDCANEEAAYMHEMDYKMKKDKPPFNEIR